MSFLDIGRSRTALVKAVKEFSDRLARGSVERDLTRTMPLEEFDHLRRIGIQAARIPEAYGAGGRLNDAYPPISTKI